MSLAAGVEHGDPKMTQHSIPWEGQGGGSSVDRFLRVPDIERLCFIL